MKALCWFTAIAAIAAGILLFKAYRPNNKAAVDFQAYSTKTVDMLKGLEDPQK